MMKKKNKGTLFAITIYYLIMLGINLAYSYLDDVSVQLKGVLALGISLISVIIPIITNLILKKKNELSWMWVLLSAVIIILRIFGMTGLTFVAGEFVENNKEIINSLYNSIGCVIHYGLLYLTSLASALGYKKKKPKERYDYLNKGTDAKLPCDDEIFKTYGVFK